jgi:hypothetical protein
MGIKRIQARMKLLNRIITAIKEAEVAGVKNPLDIINKLLKYIVYFKSIKSCLAKRRK